MDEIEQAIDALTQGTYRVGHFGISIFGGYHHWEIIGPDGNIFCTVLGDMTPPEPGAKFTTQARSRAPADKIVEALNKTLTVR